MSEPTRILALHAHPDDLEIQVAGTLALLRRAGHHVVMATMTPGDCGSAELDDLEAHGLQAQGSSAD